MKHFIFDLGGVIARPMKRDYIYQALDYNIDYETFKYIFSDGEEAIKLHKGEISLEKYFKFLKQYIKEEITLEQFLKIYNDSKEGFYKEAISIIKYLKSLGSKIYLLSNLRKIDFEIFEKEFDISIFNNLFLSYEMDMLKPNDDIYQAVIEKINDAPENMYFFDDSEANIKGALRNKINAYQVTGENIKEVILNCIKL